MIRIVSGRGRKADDFMRLSRTSYTEAEGEEKRHNDSGLVQLSPVLELSKKTWGSSPRFPSPPL